MEECTVTLIIGSHTLECNKEILVNASDYFQAMFNSDMIETKTNQVILKDQDVNIMRALIDCLSTGELAINDNIEELTAASVRFQMQSVTNICVNYLKKSLDDSNCMELARYAISLSLPHLYSYARRHALYYFKAVVKCDEFLELDVDQVTDYLSDRHLHCECELDILNAIDRWAGYDYKYREQFLPKLLECFHPEDLDKEERIDMESHEIFKKSEIGKRWLEELRERPIDKASEPLVLKKYHEMPVAIYSVGERIREDGHLKMDVWKFCKTDSRMKPFTKFHCNPIGSKVIVMGKDFYLTGGQTCLKRMTFVEDVYKFDGFEMTWEKVTQLPIPRRHHAACNSDTKFFLLGGFGKFRDVLDSVQEYDVKNDTWRSLPNMKEKGYTLQADFCRDKIYLCREKHIECLDLNTMSWTDISLLDFVGNDIVSVIPVAYKKFIYLFKYNKYYHVTRDGMLFTESWNHCKEWTRLDTENLEFSTYPCNEKLFFGHRMTASEGKLYMLNFSTNVLVSTDLQDLQTFTRIGLSGEEDDHCSLAILPDYPIE